MTTHQARWLPAAAVLAIVLAMAGLLALLVWGLADVPPPDVSDLVPVYPAVSNEANAGPLIVEAAGHGHWPADREAREQAEAMINGRAWDAELAAALIASNRQALTILDQALTRTLCRMPEISDVNDSLPPYGNVRNLARVMTLESRQARKAGDFQVSAQKALQTIRLGWLLAEYPECLIQFLVGLAIADLGLEEVLALAAAPTADSKALLALQKELAGLSFGKAPFVRAIQSEFRFGTNMLNGFWEGKYASGRNPTLERLAPRLLLQPNRTKQALADYYRLVLTNAGSATALLTNHPGLPLANRSRFQTLASPNAFGNILLTMMVPSLESAWVKPFQQEAAFQAALLTLALNAYQRDHGAFPDSLEVLVPQYLAQVPLDPFDNQPFRYLTDQALVYSIGKDLTDSGGQESTNAAPGAVPSRTQQRRTSPDMVFHLTPIPDP